MKKKCLFLIIFCSFFLSMPIKAATLLGQLTPSKVKLVYDGVVLNTYHIHDANYVAVSDLRQFGFQTSYLATKKTVNIIPTTYHATTSQSLNIKSKDYALYEGTVYLGNMKSQALICGNSTLIPIAALRQLGTLNISDDIAYFTPTGEPPIKVTEKEIINLSDVSLNVSVLDLYWDHKEVTQNASYMLSPGETLERFPLKKNKDCIYITSLVRSVQGDGIDYTNNSYNGQLNIPLMKQYTAAKEAKIAEAKMVNIYGDPITMAQVTQAENLVNSKGLSSPTSYLVWTNIGQQKTYIFTGSKGKWQLTKCFICSTGRDRTPTPKGTFALTQKVPSFGQAKGYCCKYAFGFIGTSYLYHSIIYDKTGSYLLENKGVLGRKASEGCIRFSTEHAKWFYNNLLSGTTVYIS